MARDLLKLCRRACKVAERLGVEAEAFASWRRETETDIEGTNINIGTDSTDFGIGIRVMKDKRIGYAYTSVPSQIPRTVRKALSASRLGNEVKLRFAPAARFKGIKGLFDKEVEDLGTEAAFSITKDIIEGARSVSADIQVPSGGLLLGAERLAIVNTRGLEVLQSGTVYSVSASTVAGKADKTSGFDSSTSRALDVDAFAVGVKAATLAKMLQGGRRIKGGRMDVVLTPPALAELLSYTLTPSFHGERVATGESFLKDGLGKRVTGKGLTVLDDGKRPGGLGSGECDDEGTRSKANVLIKDGVLKMFIYDIGSAAKYGARPTGSGLRPGFRGVPSTSCRNIVVEGRGRRLERIVSSIDKGVMVHDIMGAHTANMASTDFSVNSAALFMIEKGEITYPISNAMVSGNLGSMLEAIGALGDDTMCIPSGAAYYLPSIWFKKVQVTG